MVKFGGLRRLSGAVAACALLPAMMTAQVAHAQATYVYKGNGSDGRKAIAGFESFLGRKADGVVDFIAFDSWSSFDSDAAWGIGGWKGSGYKLAESVPLTVNGTSLADVAAGKQDSHFTKLAQTLVSNGFPDAYIRLGWEFNGGWYPWAFKGHEADFSKAFAHVVKVMRAVSGTNFKFVWNPALFMQQQWPDAAYPGDDVVDVIATDAYNQSWDAGYTDATKRWNSVLNDSWGISNIVIFAQKHGKPYAFPEWGTGTRPDGHGGGDDPLFVHNMAPYVKSAAFAGYWDYPASDYNALISTGQYPNAAKEFKADFAGATTPAAPTPTLTATPAASTSTSTSSSTTTTQTTASAATTAPAAFTVYVSDGGSAKVTKNADGSATIALTFPKTASSHHYTIYLSSAQSVETWGVLTTLGWDSAGGTATVHVNAPAAQAAASAATASATVAAKPLTASVNDGGSVKVALNADGSGVLNLAFPTTGSSHHYTIYLSQSRHVETWGSLSQLGWDTKGGTATVHFAAN